MVPIIIYIQMTPSVPSDENFLLIPIGMYMQVASWHLHFGVSQVPRINSNSNLLLLKMFHTTLNGGTQLSQKPNSVT